MNDFKFDLVAADLRTPTRAQTVQFFAAEASKMTGVPSSVLLQGLGDRRRMERMCLGCGVAIADLKVEGLSRPFMAFGRFHEPVRFAAVDRVPVRLFGMVLSPSSDGPVHLRRLARVSRMLKSETFQQKVSVASDEADIRSILAHPVEQSLAA